MELALVYDLNFKYSLEKVYKENYLGKMIESFENKELFEPFIKEINEYMKGEIENVREEI